MIAEEVRRQVAQAEATESKGANDGVPPSLTERGAHLFLASDRLEVENASTGETCIISQGDAIEMDGALPRSGADVSVLVRASKGSNCRVNTTVLVPLTDLVEMHNSMREGLDRGMEALRTNQGIDNLPMLPAEAAAEPVPTAYGTFLQPDSDVAAVLAEENARADRVEEEVISQYRNSPATEPFPSIRETRTAAPPNHEAQLLASIQTGQTESQVAAILGPPLNTSFLGGVRKSYQYQSGSVIFTDGEVSEVQAGGSTSTIPTQTPVVAPALPGTAGIARPAVAVSVGQTESEVVAALGPPLRVSFLGGLKKQYEYRDRKIIFTDGAVSEVY
jgi:hypothetical protein